MAITRFEGKHFFLSNFYRSDIAIGDKVYPTAEHLYQSLKTADPQWAERIRAAATPGEAKKLGQQAPLIENWEAGKLTYMEAVVSAKFSKSTELHDALLETGHQSLVEGNHWHDQFWGNCSCPKHNKTLGLNALGIILMHTRMHLHNRRRIDEAEPWTLLRDLPRTS